jgi:D-alanyl-D-alanine carboxypeptidase
MCPSVFSGYAEPTASAPRTRAARVLGLALAIVSCAGSSAPSSAAAATTAASAESPADAAELTARLDALFTVAYPPDEPGAAVRVQRGDEVLLRKGYGMADMELDVPVAPEMVFHLCSITKPFTAVGVLMLASERKIELDAPLGRYLPDYPQPGASATIHQLLTHTSGIPSYTDDPNFWETACLRQSLDQLISTWKDKPLHFAPGTDWRYSNSGYVLLGKVIEVVSERDYAHFMEERMFAPLGLEHSAFADAAPIIPGRVRGYEREDGEYRNAPCVSMSLAHAAGGLLSSVDDMIAWMTALFGSERLLSGEWRQRLLAPAVLTDGRSTAYACGFETQTLVGHRIVFHGGGGAGFTTFAGHVPDADLTVVVLSNRAGASPSPQTLALRAAALVLGARLDDHRRVDLSQAIEIRDTSLLDALVGRYELVPGFIVEVHREGDALMIQPTGQPALRVYPESESRWFPREIDAAIEFEGFADGRADALVLTQDGREMRGTRVP